MTKPEEVTFSTIEQIKAHQFVGNAFSDGPAFEAIDAFALNEENSLADRAEALRIQSDRGMGMGRMEDLSDEQVIEEFLSEDVEDDEDDEE